MILIKLNVLLVVTVDSWFQCIGRERLEEPKRNFRHFVSFPFQEWFYAQGVVHSSVPDPDPSIIMQK
jgi:hypothetical protein